MTRTDRWPRTAIEARDLLRGEPGYLQFDITDGNLYGETDQGWCLLWCPAMSSDEPDDPAWDVES